jgi:hypothetical protein
MLRLTYFLALSLLCGPLIAFARETPDHSSAFTAVPELTAGFDLLYEQKFAEARGFRSLSRISSVLWTL